MTEREFNRKVEDMADRFERYAEASADRFDRKMTHAWDNSRLFRLVARSGSIAAELGLLLGARHLHDNGFKTAAIWCAGLSLIGLSWEIVRVAAFRKKG